MRKEYKVWIKTENVGDKKLATLFVTHNGISSIGIKIGDKEKEIPKIINVLQQYLISNMPSDDV